MNVEELINFPPFTDFKILAGHGGINEDISTVTVMDAPDIYNWLSGGEFLITSGYILKDDPLLIKDLLFKIKKAGAVALGIKIKRFIHEIPKEVLDTANQLDFPIIEIPTKYSFADIINPVLSEIVNKQARILLYSQKVHKIFTDLVIKGGSIDNIIKNLGSIIDRKIIYYDTYFDDIYYGNLSSEEISQVKTMDILKLLSLYRSYQIKIDNKSYGYIIAYGESSPLSEYGWIVADHAATVLKLEIQKKISNLQIETRYRDEFIQDLIMNNVKSLEEIRSRSELYEWDFEKGNMVVILDIDNFKKQYLKIKDKNYNETLEEIRENIFNDVKKIIRLNVKDSVYTTFSDNIVFIIKVSQENLYDFKNNFKNTCTKIREEILKKYNFTITIGIGEYKTSPMDIHISYDEAKKAIKAGRSIYNSNKTIFYEDLGIYRLFDNISNTEDFQQFYITYIGNLIEYDKNNNTDFLNTLKYLVKNDWNLKETAKEIYIHYNTMKYRFNKICDILNMNLKDSEEKLNIAIALKILHMAK